MNLSLDNLKMPSNSGVIHVSVNIDNYLSFEGWSRIDSEKNNYIRILKYWLNKHFY